MPKRALFIVNRKSRSGDTDIDAAVALLRSREIDIVDCPLDRPESIPVLIKHHRGRVDCVIIGGGDGTLNAAAPALLETQLPLGIIPLGTANDLARTLAIPTDIELACDIISAGLSHRIDLGSVNGRYYFNVANIGLGVHVKHHLSDDLKQRWGVFSYARSLFKAVKQFRPFHAVIVCDGRYRRVRTIQIAVGNGRHYGGGMTVAEEATIDDHQFFLYSLEPIAWWQLIKYARALRTGRFQGHHPVAVERGTQIDITTRRSMDITADGELVTRTPAHFKLLPSAISVFVPQSYFDNRQETSHAA